MAYISLTCPPDRWLVSEGRNQRKHLDRQEGKGCDEIDEGSGKIKKSTHRLSFVFHPTDSDKKNTQIQTLLNMHLYFAACSGGSALLLSVEVFWKQSSDEATVRKQVVMRSK